MKTLSKNQEVITRKEDGEWVLFNPQTSAVHIISSVGFAVFENCNGERSRDDIINFTLNDLNIQITSENRELLNDFIEDLMKRNLIWEDVN